jgi:hypothetical protein
MPTSEQSPSRWAQERPCGCHSQEHQYTNLCSKIIEHLHPPAHPREGVNVIAETQITSKGSKRRGKILDKWIPVGQIALEERREGEEGSDDGRARGLGEAGLECMEARGDEVRGHAEEDGGVEDAEAGPGEAEVDKRGDGDEQVGVVTEEREVRERHSGVGRRADGLEEERELVERVEGEVATEVVLEVDGRDGARHGGQHGEDTAWGVRGDGVGVGGRQAARGMEVLGDGGARGGDCRVADAVRRQVPQLRHFQRATVHFQTPF